MKIRTMALATAFALSSTFALAQSGGNMGNSNPQQGGAMMKEGTTSPSTQSNMPSSKDASTQGANTAGSAAKKGDAASPGGTMKK